MKHILLIEDEPGLVMTIGDRLRRDGYTVDVARDGEDGLHKARSLAPNLIILDIMLPKKSGLEVCTALRNDPFSAPILMLTAKSQIYDKVAGLKLGADDYLTKPFDMSELVARIEALLRRTHSKPISEGQFAFGSIEVDFRKAEVLRAKKPIDLSAQEYRLLKYMIAHRGATLSRDELLQQVWNYDDAITTRTIDVHIAGLRHKLEINPKRPQFFITVHRLGYKFAL